MSEFRKIPPFDPHPRFATFDEACRYFDACELQNKLLDPYVFGAISPWVSKGDRQEPNQDYSDSRYEVVVWPAMSTSPLGLTIQRSGYLPLYGADLD